MKGDAMRASNRMLLILLTWAACLHAPKLCSAQELLRYQPSSPTVSPYLNLGRFNTSGLPNYYTLVRPLNRQRQVNTQAQRLQRQQGAALQRLERAVQPNLVVPQVSTGTSSQFLNSGSRAVYRDTRQFYPPVILRR